MPAKISWKSVYNPPFDAGGLEAVTKATTSRMFDDFEYPETTGTISAAWTGTNVTVTQETTSPVRGEGSMKVVVAGGTGVVYKALDRAFYGYPFPGNSGIPLIRYVTFKATCSGSDQVLQAKFSEAGDANHYRYWSFTVSNDKYREFVVDLDPDNTESFPAPTEGSTLPFAPEMIDRFGFSGLANGITYYIDDIVFYYEYSLVDMVGFGTEAPVEMGDIGSVQARLNSVHADVKALEGRTYQYDKISPNELEVGDEGVWALELLSDFAPPTTTEIIPGVYQIDRVRHGGTSNIVAASVLQTLAGSMYMTYQPDEDNWTEGDLIKVTFSKGVGPLIADEYLIKTDEDPSNALIANGVLGENHVNVANAYEYQVGWQVRVKDGRSGTIDSLPGGNDIVTTAGDPHFAADDVGKTILNVTDGTSTTISIYVSEHRVTLAGLVGFNVGHVWEMSATEYLTVDSLPDPTTVQFTTNLVDSYPVPSTLIRIIQTDLDTAVFYTRLTREPMIEFEGNSFFESDREDGAHAHALPNSHWGEGVYKLGAAGTQSAVIAGGKVVVSQSVATGDYAAKDLYSIKSKYFRVVVDLDVAFTTPGTGSTAGLAMVKGTAYILGNNVEIYRFNDGTDNHIISRIQLGGGDVSESVDTTDDSVALMIERNDRTWRTWYSFTKFPDYEWVLLDEVDDAADAFGEQSSAFLFAGTSNDAGVIVASFDNFKYLIDSKFLEQMYDIPAIIPIFDKQVDPRVDQNTTDGIEIFRVGLMDIKNGLPTTAEITPGTTLVDRYREGADSDEWTNQAGEVITNAESAGYISALYDFPNAIWQPGDQARMRLTGVLVTDATTSRVYNVPDLSIYFVVGGPPNADYTDNLWLGDVIGNKWETPVPLMSGTPVTTGMASIEAYIKGIVSKGMSAITGICNVAMGGSTTSIVSDDLIGYGDNFFNTGYQMIILKNASGTATAPEMEMRDITAYASGSGTFTTEAFSANVEASDAILVIANSLAVKISVYGIADVGSTNATIRDAARTEVDNWWNGQVVMMLSGLARGQIRPIVDFVAGTDDITVSPVFDAVPAIGDVYAILTQQFEIVPESANGSENYTTPQVIGRKDDIPVPVVSAVASNTAYLKAEVARGMAIIRAKCTSAVADPINVYSTDLVGFYDNFFNNQFYMQVTQANAAVPEPKVRKITDYVSNTGQFVCDTFTDNVESGDDLLIIHESLVAIGRNDADNAFVSDLVNINVDGSIIERIESLYNADTNTWYSGAAQRSLADMPFIQVSLDCLQTPFVGQDAATLVANLSIHNQRIDSDLVLIAEITTATITINRYRRGTDAGFVALPITPINAVAMTKINGGATYAYTFPSADWNQGDLVKYMVSGVVVTIEGQAFQVPNFVVYGKVGAEPNIVVQASIDEHPTVDQDANMNFAFLSIMNTAGDTDLVQDTEITTAPVIEIKRHRAGTDTGWAVIVPLTPPGTPVDMSLADGYAYYTYTFPSADWTNGDRVQVSMQGGVVTIAGQTYPMPSEFRYAVVGPKAIIEVSLSMDQHPTVDQGTKLFADLTIANVAGGPLVTVAQVTTAPNIALYRAREGYDATWSLIVASTPMTVGIGEASYSYDFPIASWANGDRVVVVITGGVVTIAGQIYSIPSIYGYSTVDIPSMTQPFMDIDAIDDFETYLDTTALKVVWKDRIGLSTITLETAGALGGTRDMKVVIAPKTGTHTAADDPVIMTDAAATFVIDGLIGLTINNVTDGSSGVITDNDGTSITVAALTGGSDDSWDTGDAYSVAGNGEVYRALPQYIFDKIYPRGRGKLLYFLCNADVGTPTVGITIREAANPLTNYKTWNFTLSTVLTSYHLDFQKAASATGGGFDSNLCDEIAVTSLDDGRTFYFKIFAEIISEPIRENLRKRIVTGYDSTQISTNEDGSVMERLEQIQEAVNKGTGTPIASNKSLVDALGSDGTTVTDSSVTVLGAIGANNADNAFASNLVAPNAVGSVLERLEDLHGDIGDATGLFYSGTCTSNGTEFTAICLGLAGFGNDTFNTKYYIQIIYNLSGAGTSPEPKVRQITDYDSSNGTFTFATVTDAPVIGDKILIFHESLAAVGRNDDDNAFDSSSVVANPDGSILERLEDIHTGLGGHATGLVYSGTCESGTDLTAVCASLSGFGNDVFNTKYFIQIIYNAAGGAGASPEPKVRLITDYDSGSGTFTFDTVTDAVAVGDKILILHESLVAVGRNDADNAFDSSLVVADPNGSVLERLESLKNVSVNIPLVPEFSDFWETETIEADVWTETDPATGTLAVDATEAGRMKVGMSPNADEVGRLVTDVRFRVAPGQVGTNSIIRKLVMQFEGKFTNVANMDNTLCLFGLSAAAGANRSTVNIVGFTLTGDALYATTDAAGTENDAACAGVTLTNWNKFRIEAYAGNIVFIVNEVVKQTFTANLPNFMMYMNFFIDTEGGVGATTFDLGPVRAWYEDAV